MVVFTLHKDSIELNWDKRPVNENGRTRIIRFDEVKNIWFVFENKKIWNALRVVGYILLVIIGAFLGGAILYSDIAEQEIEMVVERADGKKEVFDIVLLCDETKQIEKQIQQKMLEINADKF
ncbi:MAG: hypothetical protein IAF38_07550 [Bacteroidia bacterium]|nr:hypothetical protein [Bacteroidia bacterium]